MTKRIIRDIVVKKITKPTPKSSSRKNFLSKAHWAQKNKQNRKTRKVKKGRIIFSVLVLTLFVIIGVKTINIFSKTIIQLIVHKEIVSIDTVLKLGENETFDLPLETIEIQATKQKTVKATDVKNVETKASGKIMIYNSFSSQKQTLIANTRFETPDGKIYRINKSIIVPGAKVNEGTIIPSSVEATVYADGPGEEYNIDLTDFTIPGFKDGARYDKFYGRSKTKMTGGFKGEVPVISDEDFEIIKKELQDALKDSLVKQAVLQTPEEFLLYEDTIEIIFSDNKIQDSISEQDNKKLEFVLNEEAVLFAPLFSKNKLSQILTKKYLEEEFQNAVKVANLEGLNFKTVSKDLERNEMVFRATGEAEFVWLINEEKLKEALIASAKEDSNTIFDIFLAYPSVDKASVVFKPSWWKFFPNKTSKILIETN